MSRELRIPPLRSDPLTPDQEDGNRIQFVVKEHWAAYDDVFRPYERACEDNVRMILGQQHMQFNPFFGRYVNVAEWLNDKDRRFRQRATINRMLYWYMLTHARMTENPPVASYQPATGDRIDAMKAEVADAIAKHIWRMGHLEDVHEEVFTWVCAAGRGYIAPRIDPNKGDFEPWIGEGVLSMQRPDGTMIERYVPEIPYDANGQPAAQLVTPDEYQITGEPHMEREGQLVFDVLSPLQVRFEWGSTPFYRKRWHCWVTRVHVDLLQQLYGQMVDPQQSGPDALQRSLEMRRMLYGSGFFDATSAAPGADSAVWRFEKDTVPVYTYCCEPGPGYEETPDSPGGRFIVCTPTKVLYDGHRPARWPYTSCLHSFGFVRTPGRQIETTPAEALKPLQKVYNRGATQILRHRDLQSNPQRIIDTSSGINTQNLTNEPGQDILANRRSNIPAVEYVTPPSLPSDVWRIQDWLRAEMQDIGNIEGAEGRVPTSDASGELVTQLRFNADRFLGPSLRRASGEYARLIETCFAYIPIMWSREKIISAGGVDNAAVTITVLPNLFEQGRINVVPDLESMLPESRTERRMRIERYFTMGLFGDPVADPTAKMKFLEMVNFPHPGRLATPGGVDGVTAQQENAQLIQGVPAQLIPVHEWYDHMIHLFVHERFMKSPEFKQLDPMKQLQFALHWEAHRAWAMALAVQNVEMTAMMGQGSMQVGAAAQQMGLTSPERQRPAIAQPVEAGGATGGRYMPMTGDEMNRRMPRQAIGG